MPDLQSVQSSVLRNGQYALVGGYLSVVPKRVLFARAVNMPTGIGDQLTAITYDDPDGGTGSYTDVPEDAEIVLYDQATITVKGRLRVAYGGASSTVIQINEVSAGRIAVQDNDRFEVWDEYRLHDKLVAASDTFDKDSRRAYTDEGEEPDPICIVGGAVVGWADPTTGILEANIDAGDSYSFDPDNTSGVSWTLDPADGTITSNGGDDTTSPFTVEFDVSNGVFRHATMTIEDLDSSKTTTRKIPVWSHDADHLPIMVYRASLNYDRARGDWSAQFTLDGDDATIDLLRDGAYCVYWEVERYGTTEASYGNPFTGRSHIKFAGFLRRESLTISPDNDTLTIEAISPLGKLAELAGFSQVLDYATSPANWQQDEYPTVNKMLWYAWNYHTNASRLFDLVLPDTDYPFPDFALQQDTLAGQLRELANAVSCVAGCDRTGRFLVRRNLQRATTTERSAADTVLALTAADITEIPNWTREHAYQYNSALIKMYTTAGDPMLSIAPGEAPAEAPDRATYERGIALDQTEANWISAWYWQEINSLYDGKFVEKAFTCKPHPGYDVVDPAYDQWLTVTLAATTNRRGRSLSADRFIMTRVTIDTNPTTGLKDISWVMDHETYTSQPGITRIVPPEATLPPYNPSSYVPTPLPLPSSISRLPKYTTDTLPTKLFVLDAGGAHASIATAWSPSLSSLTYTDISTGLSGAGIWACSDPYDYRRRFVLTTTGLYRCDNIWAFSTWMLVANNATIFGNASYLGKDIQMSINRKGYIAVCTGQSIFSYSTDYGATWNVSGISFLSATGADSTASNIQCKFALSPFNNGSDGRIYAVVYLSYTSAYNIGVFRSEDWGATWAQVNPSYITTLGNDISIIIPYRRSGGTVDNTNNSSQELYLATGVGYSGDEGQLKRSTDAGASWSTVNSGGGGWVPAGCTVGRSMQCFTYDGAIIGYATLQTGPGQNSTKFRYSDDSGATYSEGAGYMTYFGNSRSHVNGFSIHSQAWLYWNDLVGTLYWTVNNGVAWQSVALPTEFTGSPKHAAYVEWDLSDFIAPAA